MPDDELATSETERDIAEALRWLAYWEASDEPQAVRRSEEYQELLTDLRNELAQLRKPSSK